MTLHTDRLRTLQHVREFLEGNQEVDLVVATRAAAYGFIEQTLGRFDYVHQGKAEKGLLRCFLAKVTGLSRAQLTRLLAQHRVTGASPTAAGRPDGRSPAATRASTSGFSPSSTGSTAPCPGRPRASSVRAPTIALATAGSNAWPASPTATSTTCGIRPRINGAAEPPPPGRAQSRAFGGGGVATLVLDGEPMLLPWREGRQRREEDGRLDTRRRQTAVGQPRFVQNQEGGPTGGRSYTASSCSYSASGSSGAMPGPHDPNQSGNPH